MFNKDILLIDLEATGLDVRKHELIEIAAILLDKKTLKEKKRFQSFIKPRQWQKRDAEAMAVNKIPFTQLKNAPSLKTVLKKFTKTFPPSSALLSHYGGNMDVIFLDSAYKQSGMVYPYDHHTFNIWVACYIYMARKNKLHSRKRFSGFHLEDIAKHFKIAAPTDRHTALADCLYEADVLREVMKAFRKIWS